MTATTYRVHVDVVLPDDLDGGTLNTVTSILLGALHDADVPVTGISVEART